MLSLEGKQALVTGASRGIGRAIALGLAAQGARVGVHFAEQAELARQTAELCGRGAYCLQADFRQPQSIEHLTSQLLDRLPGGMLDILVHNAGLTRVCGFASTRSEEFDELLGVNLRAPFFLTQALLPHLAPGGRVVMISSVAARLAYPSECVYALTKAALEALVRQLAPLLGPRQITVNAVAPGFIRSDMTPEVAQEALWQQAVPRVGVPEDVAQVVVFLAGASSGWISGQVLEASGGMS